MKKFFSIIILMLTLCVVTADAQEKGIASYYGLKAHGRKTYSGERHDAYGYVCAHKKHPMGTKLRVTNQQNGKSVVVKVNDRGPFHKGWVVDLSWAAAKQLGILSQGIAPVVVEVVKGDAKEEKKEE